MKSHHRLSRNILFAVVASTIAATTTTALAFDVPVHVRITNGELQPLRADIGGRKKGFSKKAIEQIAQANEDVDDWPTAALVNQPFQR